MLSLHCSVVMNEVRSLSTDADLSCSCCMTSQVADARGLHLRCAASMPERRAGYFRLLHCV